MDIDYKLIGDRLRKARIKKGYTQSKLAEIIGVSVPYLSRIETGATQINLKRLNEICSILGISGSSILEGTSESSSSYLNEEFSSILKDCTPDKKELIYQIATIISKKDSNK